MLTRTLTKNALFQKGDKVTLMDGSPGIVEDVIRTDLKNIYKISFASTGEDGYFEEDKLVLAEKRRIPSVWQKLRTIFPKD